MAQMQPTKSEQAVNSSKFASVEHWRDGANANSGVWEMAPMDLIVYDW
jgi:hypothetical protein